MTARKVSSAEFDRLIIANPEAAVEVDTIASEYRIRTATGREYRTAFGDLAGQVERQRMGGAA